MKEIKPQEKEEAKPQEPKPLMQEVKELAEFKNKVMAGEIKTRTIKSLRKAKVKRGKLRKGYMGIMKIDENRNMSLEKQRVSGSAYRTEDGIYHATDGRELIWFMGKYPIVIQPSWRNNPLLITPSEEKNETYGQPYIKAKLLADTIKVKAKASKSIIFWIIGIAVAVFGINYLTGGKLFG